MKLLFILLIISCCSIEQQLIAKPVIDPEVLAAHQKLYQRPAVEIITHPVQELPVLPHFPLDAPIIPKYKWGTDFLKDKLK